MSKCIEITLRRSPRGLPSWCYDEFGRVSFDLPVDLDFSKTKKSEQLNEFNQLTGSAILGFSLPPTDKNKLLLGSYGCATVFEFDHKQVIPVIVREAGRTLQQSAVSVLGKNREGWEVELSDGSEFWRESMKDFRMCDIPYGEIELTEAYLRDNWANSARFDESRDCMYWPLIHYGGFDKPASRDDDGNIVARTDVRIADFRPWLHVLGALQKGFCQKGYEFRSPILESEEMRHWISYVLSEGLDSSENRAGFRTSMSAPVQHNGLTRVEIGTNQHFITWMQFDDDSTGDNYDTSSIGNGYFDPSAGNHYATDLGGTGNLQVCVDMNTTQDVVVQIWINQAKDPGSPNDIFPGADEETLASKLVFHPSGTGQICFDFNGIKIFPNRYLRAYIGLTDPLTLNDLPANPPQFAQATMSLELTQVAIEENMVLDVSTILDCDLLFLDYFAGILHALGGGKIVTDFLSKTVTVYHRDSFVMRDGSTPEPFFIKNRPVKGVDILCDSEQIEIKSELDNRYLRLKFKDPTDARVDEQGFDSDNPLHGREIDFGQGLEEDYDDDANPTFEASSMIRANDITSQDVEFRGVAINTAPEIPALWDNLDFDVSNKLAPRLLTTIGYINQYRGVDTFGAPVVATWSFERNLNNATPTVTTEFGIPYAFHINTEDIGPNAASLQVVDRHLVYGEEALDLYEMFWRQKLLNLSRLFSANYRGILDLFSFDCIDFRKELPITYEGKTFYAEILGVEEFSGCPRGTARFDIVPVSNQKNC